MIGIRRIGIWPLHRFGGIKYGPELHVAANAASDPNGNEADAITGWTNTNIIGVGANKFESQDSIKHKGLWSFLVDCNDTPTPNEYIQYQFVVETGESYLLSFYWRHVGIGLDWKLMVDSVYTDVIVTNSDIEFQLIEYEFVASDALANVRFLEANVLNNGGFYMDSLSFKKKL